MAAFWLFLCKFIESFEKIKVIVNFEEIKALWILNYSRKIDKIYQKPKNYQKHLLLFYTFKLFSRASTWFTTCSTKWYSTNWRPTIWRPTIWAQAEIWSSSGKEVRNFWRHGLKINKCRHFETNRDIKKLPRQIYSKLFKFPFKHFNSKKNVTESYTHPFEGLNPSAWMV